MRLNSEDGGSRRYIIAQIAEPCDTDSNAYRNGWKTIAEVGKERIRRAGNQLNSAKCDTGFRVMKVAASNFEPLERQPDDQHQQSLLAGLDNIRKDRTPDDLIIQVMLDWGVDLALPISNEKIAGKTVFFVDGNALAACFDTDISEELVTALAKRRLHDLPLLKVVFRDAGYASDSAKINVEQIFKLLSPTTELRTL
jgi:adenine-specific DNA-methyltransferase